MLEYNILIATYNLMEHSKYITSKDIKLLKEKQIYTKNLLIIKESFEGCTMFLSYEVQGSKRVTLAKKISKHRGVIV